jgi:hypothetical protein
VRYNATVKEVVLKLTFICPYVFSTYNSWMPKAGKNELRKLYQGVDVQANGPEIGRRFFELLTEDFVLPPVAGKP